MDDTDESDRESDALVRRAGLEHEYTQVAPTLYAWAELRIRPGMRGRIDPQDLVQEVWLRVLEIHPRGLAAAPSFRAWILRVAKNVLLEGLRRAQRAPEPHGAGPSSRGRFLSAVPESVTSLTQRLARDDAMRSFVAGVRELSPDDARLLVRCGLEQETCAQVAAQLGLSEEAVYKRWQRLRAKLRDDPRCKAFLEAG
jgi:RNA polymerase sigma factor (sigma-70 family)